jgi:uncharacterized protein (TIGR03435 family)
VEQVGPSEPVKNMFRSVTLLSLCAWLVMPGGVPAASDQARGRDSFDTFQIGAAGPGSRQPESSPRESSRSGVRQHVVFQNVSSTLLQLTQVAYDLTPVRIRAVGLPAWVSDTKWQITATSSNANIPYSRVLAMLLNALIEHFGLRVEKPKHPLPVLFVTFDVSRNSARVRPAPRRADCTLFLNGTKWLGDAPKSAEGFSLCGVSSRDRGPSGPLVHFRSAPLAALGRDLERTLRQVVVVAPSSARLFDLDFQYPLDYTPGGPHPDVDEFMEALEQQFGARTEIRTTPVEVVEIVAARRPATPQAPQGRR